MTRHTLFVFLLLVLLSHLGGCDRSQSAKPPAVAPPKADTAPPRAASTVQRESSSANTAEALLAAGLRIRSVEVLDPQTRQRKKTLNTEQITRIKSAIAGGNLRQSFTATPPPWDVVLRFGVPGREPFVAHLVGTRALRLNANAPFSLSWSDEAGNPAPGVQELAIDESLYDLLAELLGPPGKEYRPSDSVDVQRLLDEPTGEPNSD